MSRHYFDCEREGEKVRVILGYDKPLDEYFLNIERKTFDERSDGPYLYISSEDPENAADLNYYGEKLLSLGIDIPASMFKSVLEDAVNRRGNYIVEHLADGATRTLYDEIRDNASHEDK